MDYEALAQQFVDQAKSADAGYVDAQRTFASGDFAEYWERMGREAIKRLEGDNDVGTGQTTGRGNGETGIASGGGDGSSSETGGTTEPSGDVAGPRTEGAG